MTSNVKLRTRINKHASLVCITIIGLAGCCVSQSVTSPSSEVLTNWTEFHRPNMTRLNPYEKVLTVTTVRNLQRKWSYTTGNVVSPRRP